MEGHVGEFGCSGGDEGISMMQKEWRVKGLNLPVDLSQTKHVNCYEEFELDLLEVSGLE